jgi:hypothetical protein
MRVRDRYVARSPHPFLGRGERARGEMLMRGKVETRRNTQESFKQKGPREVKPSFKDSSKVYEIEHQSNAWNPEDSDVPFM